MAVTEQIPLAELRDRGCYRVGNGRVVLLDEEELQLLADVVEAAHIYRRAMIAGAYTGTVQARDKLDDALAAFDFRPLA